jgi:predicted DNA-binding protein YlxM (UPF0122 family)
MSKQSLPQQCTQEALLAMPLNSAAFLAHQRQLGNYAASTAARRLEMYKAYRNSNLTLEQVANKYGVSRQRVWQIVKRCYQIMKLLNEGKQVQ